MQNLIDFLHVAPLFIIAALHMVLRTGPSGLAWRILGRIGITNSSATVIQLALAAIGVASGANCHHAHDSAAAFSIDPCILYAGYIAMFAFRVSKASLAPLPSSSTPRFHSTRG